MRIIAGKDRGRKLLLPRDPGVKPLPDRVKESLFALIEEDVRGADVLDLYAGSGSFGLEALSRGARSVLFVERAKETRNVLRKNITALGREAETRVWPGDAFEAVAGLAEGGERFGVVFFDPPFRSVETGEFSRLIGRHASFLRALLVPAALLVIRVPTRGRPSFSFPGIDLEMERGYGRNTVLFFRREYGLNTKRH